MSHNLKILYYLLAIAITVACNHLKKNEIAKIQFSSYGCFGSEHNELTLFEANGVTKAKLEINEDTVYIAEVDQQGLEYYHKFVEELKTVKKAGYCTTEKSYIVYTKNETIERKSIGCQWDGFEYLKGALFKGQGIGQVISYEEKTNDSTIGSDFSIRYGEYDFYFNVEQVSAWCDKMMNSKDGGLVQMCKSIKREVNHEAGDYYSDNHSWLMELFTPRIININTKEEPKSLLIKHYDNSSQDRTYFVITRHNDTTTIFDSRDRSY